MRKILLLFIPLIVSSCNQYSNKLQDDKMKNRPEHISFMGLQLGTPNDSVEILINSSEKLVKSEPPEGFHYGNFETPAEQPVITFFTYIVDKEDEINGGWGMAKSDCDSITTIHFIFSQCDSCRDTYNKIRELLVEQYELPDTDNNCVYTKDGYMRNISCYWDFPDSQRITLNMREACNGYFLDYERVEIVYQDLKAKNRYSNSVIKQNEIKEKEHQQAEKERRSVIRKIRESQKL